jgi:hypothetical protein
MSDNKRGKTPGQNKAKDEFNSIQRTCSILKSAGN